MKKSIFLIIFIMSVQYVSAQSLAEIYKTGKVKLVPDREYAQNNDWNTVFATYYDTLYNRPMGNRKSIVLMPDGSVVVNHAYRNYYSLFDPKGNFVKEFGIIGSSGKQFKKTNSIKGIINNTFFTGLDNMGKMVCFDFKGNYVKTLTLDYMTRDMIPLSNNKIAVVGWVIWKDKFRDFVAIVDFMTNEQKVIWEYFTDDCDDGNNDTNCKLFNYSYHFEKRGAISINTMPYSKFTGLSSPPIIEFVGENLIVALPTTGEVLVYDINGKLKSKDKIDWAVNYISVEEQKEIQKKAIERYKNSENMMSLSYVSQDELVKAQNTIAKQMEDDLEKIDAPIPVPVFSTILKDSDDNLLFFEIPKEAGANKFNVWVYQNGGKFVCQSSFECDEYDLSITPSKMIFHQGYIYGLQIKKDVEGNPLRLVRFKITE